jgi:hypothetical protein
LFQLLIDFNNPKKKKTMTTVSQEYAPIPDLSSIPDNQQPTTSKPDPTIKDYVHAFLLKFNTPAFRTLALISCAFTPAFGLNIFESLYVHSWYLLPPLRYVDEVGSYFVPPPPPTPPPTNAANNANNSNVAARRPATAARRRHKSIFDILWRDCINISYMTSVMWLTSQVRHAEGALIARLPTFVARLVDRLPKSMYLLLTLTTTFTASFVIHYVGFGWIGRFPDYMKRAAKMIKESARNLALERVQEINNDNNDDNNDDDISSDDI